MTLDDVATEPVEIWPENLPAFNLLVFLQTQWRVSMNGREGLDYSVMHQKMDRMKLSPEEYDLLEEDMQLMEGAALACMRTQK